MTDGWRLDITPPARRELRRLDPPIRRRIVEALDQLAADPLAANLVKLTGRPESRLRVGDSSGPVRIASTCTGTRQTIARSRRPLGFSTCCTGFGPGTQRQRIACLNMLCNITIDTRTA